MIRSQEVFKIKIKVNMIDWVLETNNFIHFLHRTLL